MKRRNVWIALAFACLAASNAAAVVDMTGDFVGEGTVFGNTGDCDFVAVQAGTVASLILDMNCEGLLGSASSSGTIDPSSGLFTTTFDCGGLPGVVNGVVAADSSSFTATAECGMPVEIIIALNGTRCGNGVLDPGETCDTALGSSECCNDTCGPTSAGATCSETECTLRECDGAGSCVDSSDKPAGTQCDAGTCAIGECDGAGACAAAAPFECDSCSTCEEGRGCVAVGLGIGTGIGECTPPVDNKSILVARTQDPDTKDSVLFKWGKGPAIDPADFGNPLVDTDYQVCVLIQDLVLGVPGPRWRSIAAVDLPAGAGWNATSSGFKFKSAGAKITLKGRPDAGKSKIKVKAKGTGADMADDFVDFRQFFANGYKWPAGGPSALLKTPAHVEIRASNGKCWGAILDTPAKVEDSKLTLRP